MISNHTYSLFFELPQQPVSEQLPLCENEEGKG